MLKYPYPYHWNSQIINNFMDLCFPRQYNSLKMCMLLTSSMSQSFPCSSKCCQRFFLAIIFKSVLLSWLYFFALLPQSLSLCLPLSPVDIALRSSEKVGVHEKTVLLKLIFAQAEALWLYYPNVPLLLIAFFGPTSYCSEFRAVAFSNPFSNASNIAFSIPFNLSLKLANFCLISAPSHNLWLSVASNSHTFINFLAFSHHLP